MVFIYINLFSNCKKFPLTKKIHYFSIPFDIVTLVTWEILFQNLVIKSTWNSFMETIRRERGDSST